MDVSSNIILIFMLVWCRFLHIDACNDYKLKINHIKNCDDNSIVKIQNITATLDANCMLISKGCISMVKPFKTAKAKYRLKKAPMPDLTGNIDVCKELKNSKKKTVQFLTSVGIKCPAEVKTICSTAPRKIDLSKYKNQMSMAAGKVDLRIEVTHDTGKSCVDIGFELNK